MDYFKIQPDINEKMRAIAVDWLVEVYQEFKLQQNTLCLSVILMDKYLSVEKITSKNLQAIAITCMGLASKTEEIYPVSMDDLVYICDSTYTKKELVNMEFDILNKLNYKMYYETIIQYIKIIYKTKKIIDEDYFFSLFMASICLTTIDYSFIEADILAEKIVDFSLVLKMEPKIIESLINNDVLYSYLYLSWVNINNSDLKSIKELYSHNKFTKVSLRDIPNINCIHDSITFFSKEIRIETKMDTNESQMNIYPKEIFQKFVTISRLGSGTYGVVKRVRFEEQEFALKRIIGQYDGIESAMIREINSLHVLDHVNVIKMLGFYYDPKNTAMYISIELMDQTLQNKITNEKLNNELKASYIVQLLKGLKYIHSKNIMHRDLSANNILISNNGILKINDLGTSRNFHHSRFVATYSTQICSLWVRSIELLLEKIPYTEMIDIWSCGCIIGFILKGSHLFAGDSIMDTIYKIFQTLGTPTENFNKEIYSWPGLQNVFPKWSRKGFVELESQYPTQCEILYKMLEYNPDKRISATEALELFTKSFDLFAKMTIST
jgi:hypothetical protein